tara:strand:+ start:1496 stop:1786 length:291 start_codon:yes stop_codon:yes gene_type:complete
LLVVSTDRSHRTNSATTREEKALLVLLIGAVFGTLTIASILIGGNSLPTSKLENELEKVEARGFDRERYEFIGVWKERLRKAEYVKLYARLERFRS